MNRFTDAEIKYMRELGLDYDFNNLSEDETSDDAWIDIEDTIANRLIERGFNSNNTCNEEGLLCESLIDKIPR